MQKVDCDSSGLVEFDEFLKILKNAKDGNEGSSLIAYFKNLVSGSSKYQEMNLPFKLFMSN